MRFATLTECYLVETDFKYANFWNAIVDYADITDGKFAWATLENANFGNSNLTGANLISANCIGADFEGANLKNANLTNALLTGAIITDEQLKSAIY